MRAQEFVRTNEADQTDPLIPGTYYGHSSREPVQQIDMPLPGGKSSAKPRYKLDIATGQPVIKDPKVWRRGIEEPAATPVTTPTPKVWRRGEPTVTSALTPQEKLIAQAKQHTQTTGEPAVAVTSPTVSKILDKLFPSKPERREPTMEPIGPTSLGRREPTLDEQAKQQLDYDALLQEPNVQRMLNLIGRAEGADYDTIVGGKHKIQDFSSHPNKVGLVTKQGPSTAAGKYQITGTTYRRYADRLGIKDFSPQSQDKIALQILHDTGALSDTLKGKFKGAVDKAGQAWMSLPSSKIKQGAGPRSWDWVAKNLKDTGTNAVAAAVGAKPASAAVMPPVSAPVKPAVTPATVKPAPTSATPKFDLPAQVAVPFVQPAMALSDVISKRLAKLGSVDSAPAAPSKTPTATSSAEVKPEVPVVPTVSTAEPTASKTTVRQQFEKEFAKQRAELGSSGTFQWTNPATGKTGTYTTAYAAEKPTATSSVTNESLNTALQDILRLAGKLK